jgi:putative colanic acid biosynthesis glycosyltransferase
MPNLTRGFGENMLISIITVCYKAKKELEITINSILKQDYTNIEFVIVDGNSQDGTLQMIDKYKLKLKKKGIQVLASSEPDEGIYDAMNKGVQRTSGEWCIFMNAGDAFYQNDALRRLSQYCANDFDIIYGDAAHCYREKINIYKAKDSSELTFKKGMEFCHQSTLIKTSLLRKRGYDITYKIASDYDFFVYGFRNSAKFCHVNCIVSIFQKDGISSTNGGLVKLENNQVQFKYNLIQRKQYYREKLKAKISIIIRSLIPKSIIKKRHEAIMKTATQYWDDFAK